jgi:hypothetical protein
MRIGSKNAVRPLLRHVKNIHPSVASFTSTSSHQVDPLFLCMIRHGHTSYFYSTLQAAQHKKSPDTSGAPLQAEYGAEGTEADYDWSEDPKPLTDAEKKSLIRQMIRTDILSEVTTHHQTSLIVAWGSQLQGSSFGGELG